MSALITNAKKPRVSIVIGSEKSDKMGFTNILSKPSTIAKKTADEKSATSTCGPKSLEIPRAAAAVMMSLIIIFIFLFF